MNAGASINSKAPCHLYSSRLAGGEKICRISPEGLPFTSCLKFSHASTLSPVMPERFYQASTSFVMPEIFNQASMFSNTVDP